MSTCSLFQDLCKLLDKIDKTKGTDNKKKLFATFLGQWREAHKRLHPSDADSTVSISGAGLLMEDNLRRAKNTLGQ